VLNPVGELNRYLNIKEKSFKKPLN
jgi:hypothetical protein